MKVAHATWLLSSRGGGIPPVILSLAQAQRAHHDAKVLGVADPLAPCTGVGVETFGALGPLALGFAPGYARSLRSANPDLVHLHGLFTWPSMTVRGWRRSTGGRVVITPHGMLEPWALRRSAWKKRLFLALVEDDNLRHSALLHALCRPEADHFRSLGLKAPIVVIPNGVNLDQLPSRRDRATFAATFPGLPSDARIALFLSRVHPKKGLPHLLQAWSRLDRDRRARDWILVIAGPDQLGHTAHMQRLAADLGIADRAYFVGPLQGTAKVAAFAAAELFVLPSFSEGFSMAVLEALGSGLPVVITPQCNLDVTQFGGGFLCDPTPESTRERLGELLALPARALEEVGARGREHVAQNYSWATIADRFARAYRWTLSAGPAPTDIELP